MNEFQKLNKELRAQREIAKRELDEFPPQTRGGWGSKIAQAKKKVKELEFQYAKTLHTNAFGIFLTGSIEKQSEVAKLVRESQEGLVVNADGLYREVFGPTIEKLVGKRRTWMIDYTAKLQELLRSWMYENKITSAAKPASSVLARGIPTYDDTVAFVQELIEAGNQQTFNVLYLEKQLREQALDSEFEGKTIPVIFLRAPEPKICQSLSTALTFKGWAMVDVDQFEGKSGRDLMAAVFRTAQKASKKGE